MIQSVIVDLEIGFLEPFLNLTPADSFSYTALTSPTGWNGTLTGTYSGGPVSVSYIGTVIGDDLDVNVGADGQIGVSHDIYKSEWAGHENISEGLNGNTTFAVSLDGKVEAALSIPVAGIISATFSAEKDLVERELTIRTGAEAGFEFGGPISIDLADVGFGYRLHQNTNTWESFFDAHALLGFVSYERILNDGEHDNPGSGFPVDSFTTIRLVPEPDTLSLSAAWLVFFIAILGLRHRRSGNPAGLPVDLSCVRLPLRRHVT